MTPIQQQFEALQAHPKYKGATMSGQQPNGTFVVTVPNVKLHSGWNVETTTVFFVVPVGYPAAKPDTFWTGPLNLKNGSPPQASSQNLVPGIPADSRWFSWHLQAWNPNSDSLLTYMRMIEKRLEAVQ